MPYNHIFKNMSPRILHACQKVAGIFDRNPAYSYDVQKQQNLNDLIKRLKSQHDYSQQNDILSQILKNVQGGVVKKNMQRFYITHKDYEFIEGLKQKNCSKHIIQEILDSPCLIKKYDLPNVLVVNHGFTMSSRFFKKAIDQILSNRKNLTVISMSQKGDKKNNIKNLLQELQKNGLTNISALGFSGGCVSVAHLLKEIQNSEKYPDLSLNTAIMVSPVLSVPVIHGILPKSWKNHYTLDSFIKDDFSQKDKLKTIYHPNDIFIYGKKRSQAHQEFFKKQLQTPEQYLHDTSTGRSGFTSKKIINYIPGIGHHNRTLESETIKKTLHII